MAYGAYLKSTADERASMSSTQIARWEDFRIEHGVDTPNECSPVLHNSSLLGVPITVGEHDDTEVRDDSGNNFTFTFASLVPAGKFGVLQEYDKYADTQSSPSNTVGGAETPYDNIGADLDQNAVDDLEERGNSPPYNAESVNSISPWVRVGVLGATGTGQQRLSTGNFIAPCGLVVLKGYTYVGDPGTYEVSITHKTGDYKGVHAPSMLDGVSATGTQGTWRGNVWTKN